MCSYYQAQSQNVLNKCECLATSASATVAQQTAAMSFNQESPCTAAGNTWKCTGNVWNWPAPSCTLSSAQPDNSLGRIGSAGDNPQKVDGSELATFNWLIPESVIPSGQTQARCMIRIRYNISNIDVPWYYDASDDNRVVSNPVLTFGSGSTTAAAATAMPLRLAINSAQYGRTFQDRSYTFTIMQRPASLVGKTILNLNVRGKRGNIAQVRNCYEYDFVPLILNANVGDIVHFQWCLSDYNEVDNVGNGRDGTDRVNVVPLPSYSNNVFTPLNATSKIFSTTDLSQLAWLGQEAQYCYSTAQMTGTEADSDQDPLSCHFLNGVRDANGMPTAYFSHMATILTTGSFQFMSTRNNDFSNRSQKAVINVASSMSTGAIAGIAVGATAGVASVGGAAAFMFKKKGLLSFAAAAAPPKVV